ncbi:MAG: hypothetical protein ACUVWZ_01505 [Anaerolineae bacterium]
MLILIFLSRPAPQAADVVVPSTIYAGWAVEAYPELSAAEMETMVRRIAAAGANIIWIGHNNPGEVELDKVEPGLSYAVYEAYEDVTHPHHQTALAIIQAQHRILAACRTVGIKAVLPVGYQIQMGQTWNERHPNDLRRDVQGQPLDIYGGGVSASFYAPSYRRDIEEYYRWVDAEFVRPYADVLLMLNLADEPIGGDYSTHAEAAFYRRYGFGFADQEESSFTSEQARLNRRRLVGEFQSRYIVEYAIFSAQLWHEIHPGLPITMSFDGAQARQTFTLPDVEALFRDTPSNFLITFDAYPRDGPPHIALSDTDLVELFLWVRSVGLYSARYSKALWLWAAANSWGLSQASSDPGTISDAVANGLYLSLLVRQMGGHLQGIIYWNYNVKGQGLYNEPRPTTYRPEAMFTQVSAALPTLRRLMALRSSSPCLGSGPIQGCVLILAPPARAHEQIGTVREAISHKVQPYGRLAILAKEGLNAAVVSSLDGWSLDRVQAIVILSPSIDHLSVTDLALLQDFLGHGGRVVTPPGVGMALVRAVHAEPALAYDGLVERRGSLYLAQKGMAVLFEDKRHDLLSPFWQEVLNLPMPQVGYRIVMDPFVFHYHLGPEPATLSCMLPFEAAGYRYNEQAHAVEWLQGSSLMVTLNRREYLFLQRVPRFRPYARPILYPDARRRE